MGSGAGAAVAAACVGEGARDGGGGHAAAVGIDPRADVHVVPALLDAVCGSAGDRAVPCAVSDGAAGAGCDCLVHLGRLVTAHMKQPSCPAAGSVGGPAAGGVGA